MTKKLVVCLFIMATVLGLVLAQAGQDMVPGLPYVVVEGDTLWDLSLNPAAWREELVKHNPYLDTPERIFPDSQGMIIALIYPGDLLYGVVKKGGRIVLASSISSTTTSTTPAKASVIPPASAVVSSTWVWLGPLMLILWLLVTASAVAYFFLVYRKRQPAVTTNQSILQQDTTAAAVVPPPAAAPQPVRNPATAGPAFVQGGINTPEQANSAFQNFASTVYSESHPGATYPPALFNIIERVRGRGYGRMDTLYANGTRLDSILDGDPVWRALVEYPDGRREHLYMLQFCGNPLRTGDVTRYEPGQDFRFVPDEGQPAVQVPVPVAVPEPVVAPVVAAAEPAAPQAQAVAPVEGDGVVKIEFKKANGDHDTDLLRISGISVKEFSFLQERTGMTLRFKQQEPVAPEATPATADMPVEQL